MYWDPLTFITNALCFAGFFVVCHHSMIRRYSLRVTIVAEIVLFLVHIAIGSAIQYLTVWRLVYLPILWIPTLTLLYREKWYRIAFLFLVAYLAIVIGDLIGALFFYSPEMVQEGDLTSGPLLWRISVRIPVLLIIYLLDGLILLLIRRHTVYLTRHQYLLIILYPFSISIFMYYMVKVMAANSNIGLPYSVFTFVIVVGSMILLFILSMRSSHQTVIEAENNLLSRQLDLQLAHYQGLTAQYEDIRIMRHDIAKHMNTIQALLDEGRTEDASAFFAQVRESLPDKSYGICAHPIVDAFLHSFLTGAEADGVRTEVAVSVPPDICISPHDLICIFGNLLDNALEACKAADEPFINIRSVLADGYFLVSMDNSVAFTGPKTSRIPHLQRGLGTTILQQIAKKHDGYFSGSLTDDGHYHSELSLKVD